MKPFHVLIAAGAMALLPAAAQAQSLQQQIDNVANAQAANREARAEQAELRQERIDARRRHEAAIRAARERRETAIHAAERARAEKWQDSQRNVVLQEEKIHLQEEQTLANRENDIIDSHLYRNNARGDLTESEATSNVNLSSGFKTLLEDTGTAEIDRATGGGSSKSKTGDKVAASKDAATAGKRHGATGK